MKLDKSQVSSIIKKLQTKYPSSVNVFRLGQLLPLLIDAGETDYQTATEALFSEEGKNMADALYQFRKDLKKKAKEQNLNCELLLDSNKKAANASRLVWFEGEMEDLMREKTVHLARMEKEKPSQIENMAVPAYPAKPTLRYFISYAHKDAKRANEFLNELTEHLDVNVQYQFVPWKDEHDLIVGENWFEGIKKALDACDFGLLLLSPSFFKSQFILEHELSHFINNTIDPNTQLNKPIVPVGLEPFDFQFTETQGVLDYQTFLPPNSKGQNTFFSYFKGNGKKDFCMALVRKIMLKFPVKSQAGTETDLLIAEEPASTYQSGRSKSWQKEKIVGLAKREVSDEFDIQEYNRAETKTQFTDTDTATNSSENEYRALDRTF